MCFSSKPSDSFCYQNQTLYLNDRYLQLPATYVIQRGKCFLKVNIKVQPRPFIFFSPPLTKSCSCMCERVFFFSEWWYEESRPCHNTLLVFSGQEEPGSAPVTQLLTALVPSSGLTSSTCLLTAYLLCGTSSDRLIPNS